MRTAHVKIALLIVLAWAGFTGLVKAAPVLNAATAPDARSLAIGATGTIFAEIVNSGDMAATNCRVIKPISAPLDFSYQTLDDANALTGTPDTPVDIAAGASQRFLVTFTPTAAFEGSIKLSFFCAGFNIAPVFENVNDLFLTATAGTPPDLIAIFATPSGDGILNVDVAGGIQAAAGAVVNIGSAGGVATVDVTPTFGDFDDALGVLLSICETDPVTGACMAPPAPSISMDVGGTAKTYSVFAIANPLNGAPLFPEYIRISVIFSDPAPAADAQQGGAGSTPAAISGSTRGRASVAYSAPAMAGIENSLSTPFSGNYVLRMRADDDILGQFIANGDLFIDSQGQGMGLYHRSQIPGDGLTQGGDQVFILQGAFDSAAKTFAGDMMFIPSVIFPEPPLRGTFTAAFDTARSLVGNYTVTPAASGPAKGGASAPAKPQLDPSQSPPIAAKGVASIRDNSCSAFDLIPPGGKTFDVYFRGGKAGQVMVKHGPGFDSDPFTYSGTIMIENFNTSTIFSFKLEGSISVDTGFFGGGRSAEVKLTDDGGAGNVVFDTTVLSFGRRAEVTRCTASGFTIGALDEGIDQTFGTEDDKSFVFEFRMPMP